jgi:hypothetical protein
VAARLSALLSRRGRHAARGTVQPDGSAETSSRQGALASHGSFDEAAAFGELLFNCTQGTASVDALRAAAPEHLTGKILIDVANPLEHVAGKGTRLAFSNDDSLGERLQAAFPELKVVKTLNTVNCSVMVDPSTA